MMASFPSITSNIDPVSIFQTAQLSKETEDKIGKTAAEFEAMLMAQMFQTMRKTVESSGLFEENQNERAIYDSLFDQAILQQATAAGHTWGLAERLEESWKLAQMKADAKANPDANPDANLNGNSDAE
jgi:Rod binding domain-containing protein